jgi:hypothetical protein
MARDFNVVLPLLTIIIILGNYQTYEGEAALAILREGGHYLEWGKRLKGEKAKREKEKIFAIPFPLFPFSPFPPQLYPLNLPSSNIS